MDPGASKPTNVPPAVALPDVTAQAQRLVGRVTQPMTRLKPRLRGWIHAVATPLVLATGIVLVVLAPPTAGKVATGVFALTSLSLFGMSAVYHRGRWTSRVNAVLRRIDHANIFLIIAGTYTPLAVLLLNRTQATQLLTIVWAGALLGLVFHLVWMSAPRWVYVPIYLALGWIAMAYLREFWASGGPATVWLILGGGAAYSIGAAIYGFKRPNPSPQWFGFHEIFHALTIMGWTCHTVAIFLAVVGAARPNGALR